MNEIYYKYLSLQKIERILDIFENTRLYASKYKDLNDPMEGVYISNSNINKDLIYEIRNNKSSFRICSFTTKPNQKLMWAHYADSFKGIAIGFNTIENTVPIKYNGIFTLHQNTNINELIKNIFQNKFKEWSYEKEYRVITEFERDYVEIIPVKVILGLRVEDKIQNLLILYLKNYKNISIYKQQVSKGKIIIKKL